MERRSARPRFAHWQVAGEEQRRNGRVAATHGRAGIAGDDEVALVAHVVDDVDGVRANGGVNLRRIKDGNGRCAAAHVLDLARIRIAKRLHHGLQTRLHGRVSGRWWWKT